MAILNVSIGVAIDHRLQPLPRPINFESTPVPSASGGHVLTAGVAGSRLQINGVEKIDPTFNRKIEFTRWLAGPNTTGGLLVVLTQPYEHQKYFKNHRDTMNAYPSLRAVDKVLRGLTCDQLNGENVSIFDAFLYLEIDIKKIKQSDYTNMELARRAFNTFLRMLEKKQPSVILTCYQTKHKDFQVFQLRGFKAKAQFSVPYNGEVYKCVNGFHPSYAVNRNPTESSLRRLLTLQIAIALQPEAFGDGEDDWMGELRATCAELAKKIRQTQSQKGSQNSFKSKYQIMLDKLKGAESNIRELFETMSASKDSPAYELYEHAIKRGYAHSFETCSLILAQLAPMQKYDDKIKEENKEAIFRERKAARENATVLLIDLENICKEELAKFVRSGKHRKTPIMDLKDVTDVFLNGLDDAYTSSENISGMILDVSKAAEVFLAASVCLEHTLGKWLESANEDLVTRINGLSI